MLVDGIRPQRSLANLAANTVTRLAGLVKNRLKRMHY